ncbi:MAG: sensor histidine kinase [Oscillospiraceae bacterium]
MRIVLIVLAIASVIIVCIGSNQAVLSIPYNLEFCGEYSIDNGESWEELSDNTKLSASDGDLILRGGFDLELPEGMILNFYLDHIGMEIYVNGEISFIDSRTERELTSSGCCRQWMAWETPELKENDVVEIHLINFHKFGNIDAYNEFISSIYIAPYDRLATYILKVCQITRVIGLTVIIVSIMLLAISMAFGLLRINGGRVIGNFGLLSLFFGGYFALDGVDLPFWSDRNAFNTYTLQLCIMLAAYFMIVCVSDGIRSKARKTADIVKYISCIFSCVLILLSIFGVMVIYDTGIYWVIVHGGIFAVLLGCVVYELVHSEGKDERIVNVSNILLIAAALADMVNVFIGALPSGAFSKPVYLILFVFHIIRIIRIIPADYRSARQAEVLRAELAEKRISIMLSQIQPHFLYNSLNSIYNLCKKDVKQAQKAISDFSYYLRGNMDSLTKNSPIPFYMELKHLKTYLALEKMRFDDTLDIVWDIQTESFMIPALTVQPIAENAIKHGICQKEDGGTLKISTRETDDHFEVEVWDDGVGFDVNAVNNDGKSHIGIENVKNRLCRMCGAELTISSEIGKGTSAVIRIPKSSNPDNYV